MKIRNDPLLKRIYFVLMITTANWLVGLLFMLKSTTLFQLEHLKSCSGRSADFAYKLRIHCLTKILNNCAEIHFATTACSFSLGKSFPHFSPLYAHFTKKRHENKKWSFIKANLFCINDHHCKLTCRPAFYTQIYHPFPARASQIAF